MNKMVVVVVNAIYTVVIKHASPSHFILVVDVDF